MTLQILAIGSDPKTVKGEKLGVLTAIFYGAPANEAGQKKSLCPNSTVGCRNDCLFKAGRGVMPSVVNARIRKTRWYLERTQEFLDQLDLDILEVERLAKAKGMKPAIRLNGTTDILWERHCVMDRHPNVQFYEYTKFPRKVREKRPDNLDLTFSLSETDYSKQWAQDWQAIGVNTAVVFSTKKGEPLPSTFMGLPVIDGDLSDARFLDPKGVIVGLRAKGKARHDTSGFVQQV